MSNHWTGRTHSPETREKMRLAKLEKKRPQEVVRKYVQTRLDRGWRHTLESRRKMSETHRSIPYTEEQRRKNSIGHTKYSVDEQVYGTGPYWARWREAVKSRDDRRCRICGDRPDRSTDLHAHHIKSWKSFRISASTSITG